MLVSMQEHCDRLVAARLQADIMGTEVGLALGALLFAGGVPAARMPVAEPRDGGERWT